MSEEEWERMSKCDKDIQLVREYISKGWPKMKAIKGPLQAYFQVASELSIENDLLFRNDKCIPPVNIREKLIEQGHQGHLGMSSLKNLLRQYFWWPSMDVEAERWVRVCHLF